MASREELLQSINPEMKLDRAFFMKVYGYEISFPGFAEIAIKALEDAGCSKAREYYTLLVDEYERKKREDLYPVAVEYVKKLEMQWEKKVKRSDKLSKEKKKQSLQQRRQQNWNEMSQMLGFSFPDLEK